MITFEDCLAFCDAEPCDIERAADENQLPRVIAVAQAHAQSLTLASCSRANGCAPSTCDGRLSS